MTRPIKFRAWDPQDKIMHLEIPIEAVTCGDKLAFLGTRLWPLQFTGLLDKNGKEIYEGDIVVIGGFTEAVYFKKGRFRTTAYEIGAINPERMDVIGNIYENPELINKL